MRTTLLMWEFQGLDLIVLADESYHDQEKATEVMKQLNSDRYAFYTNYGTSRYTSTAVQQ